MIDFHVIIHSFNKCILSKMAAKMAAEYLNYDVYLECSICRVPLNPQVFIDPHWFNKKYIADPPSGFTTNRVPTVYLYISTRSWNITTNKIISQMRWWTKFKYIKTNSDNHSFNKFIFSKIAAKIARSEFNAHMKYSLLLDVKQKSLQFQEVWGSRGQLCWNKLQQSISIREEFDVCPYQMGAHTACISST